MKIAKSFSYRSVLSICVGQTITLDGTPTDIEALVEFLLGHKLEGDDCKFGSEAMKRCKAHLIEIYPSFDPMHPDMVLHYGALAENVVWGRTR